MLNGVKHTQGTCFWCSQETDDGAEFQQGSQKLFLCKKDFWPFLKNRSNAKEGVTSSQGKPVPVTANFPKFCGRGLRVVQNS